MEQPTQQHHQEWCTDLRQVSASNADPAAKGAKAEAGRMLEIFLDRVAAKAASSERSYVLDPRYAELLDDEDRVFAAQVVQLAKSVPETGAPWDQISEMLRRYGAPPRGA